MAMKERPILFSAPMVLANRAGTKSQTRRTRGLDRINEEPDAWECFGLLSDDPKSSDFGLWAFGGEGVENTAIRCPYGVAGDRLHCREAWRTLECYDSTKPRELPEHPALIVYEADEANAGDPWGKLRPGIFLPRWASRDTLEVVSVRPERLQDITEADATAEGVECLELSAEDIDDIQISDDSPKEKEFWKAMGPGKSSHRWEYEMLWSEINGPGSWAKSPFVWRIEYRRLAVQG